MLRAYRIHFLSPSTPVRSYTLFGAVCWAYRLLGGDVLALCEEFREKPPFIISSPLPLAETERGETPLFPKPVLPVAERFEREDDLCAKLDRKDVKKAKYVTFSVLRSLLEMGVREERPLLGEGFRVGKIAISLSAEGKVSLKDTRDLSVRNSLNRVTMKSEQLFTEEAYLYGDRIFFVKYFDLTKEGVLRTCLELIEDTGLGANKNLGWGSVRITDATEDLGEITEFLDRRLKPGERYITLSPVLPRKNSLDLENSYYTIETYKSPVDTTFGGGFIWKRKVLYLKEGSLIKPAVRGWTGELRDVGTESVRAFQYGYEFPISVEG